MARREHKPDPNVGHYLREWRNALGLSVETAAEMIGKSPQQLGRVERGKNNYTPELLESLSKAYKVSIADLLTTHPDDEETPQMSKMWKEANTKQRRRIIRLIEFELEKNNDNKKPEGF